MPLLPKNHRAQLDNPLQLTSRKSQNGRHPFSVWVCLTRQGLFAAGTESGEVVVWDFETRVVSRTFQAHAQAVTCVAWARNGRYLMSGSLDRSVSLWDILENKQVRVPHLLATCSFLFQSACSPFDCKQQAIIILEGLWCLHFEPGCQDVNGRPSNRPERGSEGPLPGCCQLCPGTARAHKLPTGHLTASPHHPAG